MKCKTHPKYRALRRPTADCGKCRSMFRWRRFLKYLGFSVEEAKPRTRKDQVMVTVDPVEYERRIELLRTPNPVLAEMKKIDKSVDEINKLLDETFPKQ